MKFYEAYDEHENRLDVFTKPRAAVAAVAAAGPGGFVDCVDVEITAENVRRLLAQCGGYAKSHSRYWDAPK